LRKPVIYSPYADARYLLFVAVVAFVFGLLVLNLAATAFTRIGFTWLEAILLLMLSLAGSSINIPLWRIRTVEPVTQVGLVRYGPFLYRVPFSLTEQYEMLVAVNLGGALIPILVSAYLLVRFTEAFPLAIATTFIVTVLVNRLATPVENLGIVIRGFWPPLITALAVLGLSAIFSSSHEARFAAAYVGGTLGTLLGADLLNLRTMPKLGSGIGSIGGAGTFDGIFLAGIVAVLLT
jgi:uncharacterized membrane protein